MDVFLDDMQCVLQRFRPKPGDVFVLTIPGEVSAEQAARIQSNWLRIFPDTNIKIGVLTDGMKVEMVSGELASQ